MSSGRVVPIAGKSYHLSAAARGNHFHGNSAECAIAARLISTLCLYRTGYDFKLLFRISEYYDPDRPANYKALQGVRSVEWT